jgi:hypothetical protein
MTDEICYAMKNGIPVRYVPEENYEKYTTERMNFNEIQF